MHFCHILNIMLSRDEKVYQDSAKESPKTDRRMNSVKSRRLMEMESYILSHTSASMEELCAVFDVSMNTVRRDVAELAKSGRVQKVYGGVQAMMKPKGLVPYAERSSRPSGVKRAICVKAAQMVRDGDIIFIDSGTTTMHLMDTLKGKNITVITNNIEIMLQALAYENIRLIVVPGEVHRKTYSITGEESAAFLSTMNINIAFMAATGASVTGVTNSSPLEYAIKKAAVKQAEKTVLLVTGNKFGVTSLFSYATLDQFQTVITDASVPAEYLEKLQEKGIDVQIAGEEKEPSEVS